ncbi:MAG: DNA topoisomerase 3 [Candidatus Solibacter sp.]
MAPEPSGSVAVLAEKPSVARDVARVLGANSKGQGYLYGNGYVVTWAVGHLAALAQPHEIQAAWKSWRRDLLPMLPQEWPLVVYEKTKDQFDVVKQILNSPKVGSIVCATDAGREGELIFRYIYEAAQCRKPVSRLWISSLTPEAIRRGFDTLRPASEYDGLADAARGRSRADWLVGMNLSRAYALAYDEELSVGRVQTPTLAMLVERELAVRRFVPEDYLEVMATFRPKADPQSQSYQGTWFRERGPAVAGEDKESLQQAMRLPPDGAEAKQIAGRARTGQAAIESIEAQTQRMPPPGLYDLTELQRHGNRLFGFSAQKTLDIAQALYEKHKLISYPRTDSRHLSQDVARTLPRVTAAIGGPYRELLAPGTGERPLGRRYVDDGKVTDHHAIIPTTTVAGSGLMPDERKIYDLICRRLLAAWHEDHIWNVTTVITAIRNGEIVDRYHTSGSAVMQVGWKVLDLAPAKGKKADDAKEQVLPPGLARGQEQDVLDVETLKKKTRAPKRLTEATLLTAMETAGKTLDEKELSDAMKETGLGTPATRAAIIEVLIKREYIVRNGKSLEATDKGIRLIEVVHPEVKSPAMTGQWEAYLHRIQRGSAQLGPFMKGIEDYVREVVGKVGQVPAPPRGARAGSNGTPRPASAPSGNVGAGAPQGDRDRPSPPAGSNGIPAAPHGGTPQGNVSVPAPQWDHERTSPPAGTRALGSTDPSGWRDAASAPPREAAKPRSLVPSSNTATAQLPLRAAVAQAPPYTGGPLTELLQQAFGFPSFRPSQEAVCQAVIEGRDVLLVMPTGAGKSLCYQLPGVARGGTTLVISPLIALMEDQVAKLKERGLRVARIHSGRDRAASRQACIDYLNGALQFLFIAPERLRVPGFPEMLAKRKPSLIAIDEAHCISQWGHDFRPDYRMLGQHLPTLRPAPVIALTATATPVVQNDIAAQLALGQPSRFIQGFRRDNLAVEVVEVAPSQRPDLTLELLDDDERRPAIVYTPTRAQAESVAYQLAQHFPCQAYHAGLDAERRKRVQSDFLAGRIEVMVATIAFGMGIDKPDVRTVIHTALPGSLEAYYQEIGRAGRDGKPSRTVLMHSYADRRTHDFFFDRDYPDVQVLDRIFGKLGAEPVEKSVVQRLLRMPEEEFDKALEKLWIHGGALVDFADNVTRGHEHWRDAYVAQGEQKKQQLDLMLRYAETNECRMSSLVRHFGDLADSQKACGMCDFCAPDKCCGQRFRPASSFERSLALKTVEALRTGAGRSTGKLHAEVCPSAEMSRDEFEELLGAMARANFVRLTNTVFEKDGKTIPFVKAALTRDGEALEEIAAGDLQIKETSLAEGKRKSRKKAPKAAKKKAKKLLPAPILPPKPPRKDDRPKQAADSHVEGALRKWRMSEAQRRGVPAFRIFSDQALKAIAEKRPATAAELLAIPGLGIATVEKFGAQIYRILHEHPE